MTRRIGVLPPILAAGLAWACESAPAANAPAAANAAGELRVVLLEAPTTLNPNLGTDEASHVVGRNLFNQLIALDSDQQIIPDLATAWDVSSDGRAYTFHLRRGVQWHDGHAFNSADVRWTFDVLKTGGLARETANRIVRIETPDADTVVFHLEQPWAPFLAELASYGTYILPLHVYGDTDWRTSAANEKPVGTGPFAFERWAKPGPITLVANRRYFGHGPFVERLQFVPTSADEIDNLLLDGRAEYTIVRPAISSLSALQRSTHLLVRTAPSDSRYYCAFNLARAPFSDVRVRRAINLGIDRLRLVDEALAGFGVPAFTFYTPLVEWAHNPDARVGMTDVAAARALLDSAGLHARGRRARLDATLVAPTLSPFAELADHLRDQLRAIGVAVTVVVLPPTEWARRVLVARDFDLALFGGSQGPDPDNLRVRLSRDPFIAYRNSEFDRVVEEGARTLDAGTRARAYFRAQEILADEQPVAPLAEAVRVSVYRRGVTGLPQVEARGLVAPNDFSLVRFRP